MAEVTSALSCHKVGLADPELIISSYSIHETALRVEQLASIRKHPFKRSLFMPEMHGG